ncbi:MAG: hypothetical protein AAB289_13655 [Chloroflexota bacterium]
MAGVKFTESALRQMGLLALSRIDVIAILDRADAMESDTESGFVRVHGNIGRRLFSLFLRPMEDDIWLATIEEGP